MKRLFLCSFFLVLIFTQGYGQINWTKYENNPVLTRGTNGTWDDVAIHGPNIMFDGSLYHMWYAGYEGQHNRIGYASSSDGIAWTKHSSYILDRGNSGTWDDAVVFQPSVIYDGEEWHMWFSGHNGNNGGPQLIGYAHSVDSINWTKYEGNPVMTLGDAGSWDSEYVGNPDVHLIDGTFHMWYGGGDGSVNQIGHATSTDGISWEKDPANPVLAAGSDSDWDNNATEPSVIIDSDSLYHMFYSGGNSFQWSTGYAYSYDGNNWTKYAANPVLTPGDNGGWDDGFSGLAGVVLNEESGTFQLWYVGAATSTFGGWDFGYATAPMGPAETGFDWIRNANNPVFPRGANGTWDDTFVSGPTVTSKDGSYHMWYSGYDGNNNGQRVGYARSVDGRSWERHATPVLSPGTGWDGASVFQPSVLLTDTLNHMWYCGHNSSDLSDRQIGYATSLDSINWTRYGANPVLGPGTEGSWDDVWVGAPDVIVLDGTYHMLYEGSDGTYTQIGHATSTNGISWEKDPLNPVLTVGKEGSWDDLTVGGPTLWHNGRAFYMWYAGGENTAFDWKVGYAWSLDGSHWTKVSVDDPDMRLGTPGSWDDTFCAAGGVAVLYHDSGSSIDLDMWYGGGTGFSIGDIGHAHTYVIDAIEQFDASVSVEFELSQNYPNPFNPTTTINYQLPTSSSVNLSIYNILGQKVATLVNKKQQAGKYQVGWDASEFTSGVYIYALEAGRDFKQSRKLLLLK